MQCYPKGLLTNTTIQMGGGGGPPNINCCATVGGGAALSLAACTIFQKLQDCQVRCPEMHSLCVISPVAILRLNSFGNPEHGKCIIWECLQSSLKSGLRKSLRQTSQQATIKQKQTLKDLSMGKCFLLSQTIGPPSPILSSLAGSSSPSQTPFPGSSPEIPIAGGWIKDLLQAKYRLDHRADGSLISEPDQQTWPPNTACMYCSRSTQKQVPLCPVGAYSQDRVIGL